MKKLIILLILLQSCSKVNAPDIYQHMQDRCKNIGGVKQIVGVNNYIIEGQQDKVYDIEFICAGDSHSTNAVVKDVK